MKRAWNFKDLAGQKFGRLTAIEYNYTRGNTLIGNAGVIVEIIAL